MCHLCLRGSFDHFVDPNVMVELRIRSLLIRIVWVKRYVSVLSRLTNSLSGSAERRRPIIILCRREVLVSLLVLVLSAVSVSLASS